MRSELGEDRAAVTTAEPGLARVVPRARGPRHDVLLTTKLARPRVPETYVARARASALLDAGTAGLLTVVSAGAGWGKTLTTAAWAANRPDEGPVAWLSLDENDNEPRTFWGSVLAALHHTIAIAPDNAMSGLDPALGPEDENLGRLAAGIAELPEPVVLVIDDFHLVQEQAVLDGIARLLRTPSRQLRLVLLTRADPALPLHRLRLEGMFQEVRSSDLAFDVAEGAQLLAEDGLELAPAEVEQLLERTEGWPAGLRLAALFLGRDDESRSVEQFAGDDRAVTDYLLEEVLASQTSDVRDFLIRTSVVDRVNSELAEVLAEQPRSQQHLERLERSNAFVIGLGTDRQWFRYHPLLKEMLRHQLGVTDPAAVPELHRRAAEWYSRNDHPVEALRHAQAADDWVLFGRLFVTQAAPLLVSTERLALVRVLGDIPVQRLTDSPELALCAAARMWHLRRVPDMRRHLDFARARLAEEGEAASTGAQIGLRLLASVLARVTGDIATVVAVSGEALELVSGPGATLPGAHDYRAVALSNLGTGLLWDGDVEEAERHLRAAMDAVEGTRLEAPRINILGHLALLALSSGRLDEGLELATEAESLVESRGWAPLPQAAAAYLALATVHVRRNELDRAETLLSGGLDDTVVDRSPRFAMFLAVARLQASEHRPDRAREELARMRKEVRQWQPPSHLARLLHLTEAEIELASGDPQAVVARMRRLEAATTLDPQESVCLARALLASGEPHEAEMLLAPLRSSPDPHDCLVEAWVLTALVADRLREDNRALDAMHQAVVLAHPLGVRRPFLSLEPHHVARLLGRLRQVDPGAREFAGELLRQGLGEDPGALLEDDMSEALTDRELSVLRYLPTMMTNSEIAGELFVSVNTVKAHLKRIYRKLGVVSRRAAVQRAQELGLLVS